LGGARDQSTHAVAQARVVLDENEHEHRRLLYVAMTRAAALIVWLSWQDQAEARLLVRPCP
jgi:ATP-dependent exoDNAse (exonuclease V) beta subunit